MSIGESKGDKDYCIFILTPTTWYFKSNKNTISETVTISLKYRLNNITLNINISDDQWNFIQGFFENKTSIIYVEDKDKDLKEYEYEGNVSGLISSLIEDSSVYLVRGVYSENISLKLNGTLTYNLLNKTIDLWTTTRQRILLVDFRIRATNTSLIVLGVSVNATSSNVRYNITYYADNVHRELFIPINPREILLNGLSSINSLNVTVRAYNDFNGVIDVILYVLEFPQPVLDVRINNVKSTCKPYVFLSPAIAPKTIATAAREYYLKITSPSTKVFGVIREGDELLFDYTYKAGTKIIDQELLNKSGFSFLAYVFHDLFNSTIIKVNWTASIQFKVNNVTNGIVNYILRILQLRVKYNPPPVQRALTPICGDGILGVCPVLWLNKLRGDNSIISRALAILPSPGTTIVSNIEWPYLPWATDIAFPGYQATPENLTLRPLLFTRIYLGYPFASLTPLSGAVWFTGRGIVERASYGTYREIPVVGLEFSGDDYKGYIYIDTYYLSPIKAFLKGSPNSWRSIGVEYNVYYNLDLFRWRGFWHNLTTTAIPLRIESRSSSTELLLIITQPGNETVKANVIDNAIELETKANKPTRILMLGKGKPYDVTGAYWLALPLISDIDIIYPTTLVYIDQKEPSTYNFIAAFPTVIINSSSIRLLILNGDKWLIENISVGKPSPIGDSEVNLPSPTITTTSATKTMNTTTSSRENKTNTNTIDRNIRLITGLAVFIIAVVIVLVYKRLHRKH